MQRNALENLVDGGAGTVRTAGRRGAQLLTAASRPPGPRRVRGSSERIIGRFLAGNAGQGVTVATKMGRRVEQKEENYTLENFRAWTDRSRVNLGSDRLDLVQQRAVTRFTMLPFNKHPDADPDAEVVTGWFASQSRHWNIDRPDPR